MRHEIGIEKPDYVEEAWPGKYKSFSWLEYAINIPYPIFIITTLKENGRPNACLHSWGCFAGGDRGYHSIFTMLSSYHTSANILRTGEWCINFPSATHEARCLKTIEVNEIDRDEIAASGFTVERPQEIQSPRIAECPISLECRIEWERPLCPDSRWHVFAGRIVHMAMDDAAFELEPGKRLEAVGTMCNMRATLNPLTGEVGPNGLPGIGMR